MLGSLVVISTTHPKIQTSFLTQLPERKETTQGIHHEAESECKTVTEFNGCDRRKLRIDQEHWSYSTIRTSLTGVKRKQACTEQK
jgi:hypothetical protein